MIRNAINRRREGRSDAGFTLIELLIVIVILGILAAIVVFSVRGIQDRGKASACKADVATVSTAVEAFVAQDPDGDFPADLDALVTAGLLRSVPSSEHYDIEYDPSDGGVSSDPACSSF